jgi:hypothetical protein
VRSWELVDRVMAPIVERARRAGGDFPTKMLGERQRILRSWDEPSGTILYRHLFNAFAIDRKLVEAAVLGRDFACAHLGMETPPMLFYAATASGKSYRDSDVFRGRDRNGHADRATRSIGVRVEAGTTPRLVAEVAAHECYHLTQPGAKGREAAEEAEAEAYGDWALDVLTRHDGTFRKGVHAHVGHPFSYVTLTGVADEGDVLISSDGGPRNVWWNGGSKQYPEWKRYHAHCPVETR